MARWKQPKPLNFGGLHSSPSSFIIPIIRDEQFSPEPMVFLIFNHADTVKKRGSLPLPNEEPAQKGKPAGYGMAGGGVNPEWIENQDGAAKREGGNESGLRVTKVRLLFEEFWVLVTDKRTGKLNRKISYDKSHQPKVELKPGETAILNPFSVYSADIDWPNSKPREFLLGLKKELIADEVCTAEDVARFGLSINTLTREELLELGVDEEEVGKKGDPIENCEIGGFAILPVSLLRWMWQNEWFFLNPEEDQHNKSDLTSYVYYTHVKRIIRGLDIMGIA